MNKDQLGRYRLIAELARGGMGIVWLAEMRGPGGFAKPCVIKELLPELAADSHHRAMFLDEASLAAQLVHKNIVQTNEVGCEDGRWFMALELLEGCTLRRASSLLGDRLPAPLAVRIVCEVLAALDHAHALKTRDDDRLMGIVHRDVTPQNVFLTCDGQVKLLDFGVAKSRARREKTQQGFAKGSIPYMSPDHVANAPIDRRADLFSLGIVLRELLSGQRLWHEDVEPSAILRRLLANEIPPFDDAAVPPALRAICAKAMAPRRGERWESAAAMRQALEAWLSGADERSVSLEATLRGLFDTGALAVERARAKLLRKRSLATKPPLPPSPVDLSPTELKTDPEVRPSSKSPWRRRLVTRELLPVLMAIVASIAAGVSVVASGADEDREPIRVQVVATTGP